MARADKATAVADIAEQFKESTATVVTEYRGLTVANLADLRKSLGGGASYAVAKNTLVKRAASEAGVTGLDDLFTGPTAIAFIKGEPVDAAKAIKTFAKDHKALVIKGGYMDGSAVRGRGQPHRGPRVARGAAGQAGRRDEGQDQPGCGALRCPGVAGRPPRLRAAGEEGGRRRWPRRRSCRRRGRSRSRSTDGRRGRRPGRRRINHPPRTKQEI